MKKDKHTVLHQQNRRQDKPTEYYIKQIENMTFKHDVTFTTEHKTNRILHQPTENKTETHYISQRKLAYKHIITSTKQKKQDTRKQILHQSTVVVCSTSQQHASVSQGRICSDNFTRCHTEIEAADQTFYLTQSQYTDTGPTSPSDDPITPGAWQGSHQSANFYVTGMTRPRKILAQAGFEPWIFRSRGGHDTLTTRPPRRSSQMKHKTYKHFVSA